MLCRRCTRMLEIYDGRFLYSNSHHDTLEELEAAAESGCYICNHIFGQMVLEHGLKNLQALALAAPLLYYEIRYKLPGVTLTLLDVESFAVTKWEYKLIPLSQDKQQFGFQFQETENGKLRTIHRLYDKIPPSTAATEVGDLARSWFQKCQDEHSECSNASQDWLPPRLLDLSTVSSRLVLRKDVSYGKYAALSHCWGANPSFITLTSARMDEFVKDGVPEIFLPENFRNAIEVCRWLEIRYIWIDSLCIIQSGPGSDRDWGEHVQFMMSVYENSAVTIATAAASSAEDSCFKERNPEIIRAPAVNWPWSLDDSEDKAKVQPHLLVCSDHSIRGHRNAPLASRAWVLQERMLSPRVLTLGPQQIFWECYQTQGQHICETFPSGIADVCWSRGPFRLPQANTNANIAQTSFDFHNLTDIHNWKTWLELIDVYGECSLTRVDEDKFAAFSGIAEHMSKVFHGSRYIAGLFEHEYPIGLLWRVREGAEPQSRPKPKEGFYRAPSWSWASTDALLRTPQHAVELVAGKCMNSIIYFGSVQSYTAEPVNPDNPYGQLRHSELTLNAPLVPVERDRRYKLAKPVYCVPSLRLSFPSFKAYFDSLGDFEIGNTWLVPILGARDAQGDYGWHGIIVRRLTDRLHVGNADTVSCADAATIIKNKDGIDDEVGCFMRIGVAEVHGDVAVEALRTLRTQDIILV